MIYKCLVKDCPEYFSNLTTRNCDTHIEILDMEIEILSANNLREKLRVGGLLLLVVQGFGTLSLPILKKQPVFLKTV